MRINKIIDLIKIRQPVYYVSTSDFSYKNGSRSSINYFNESFNEMSLGISIGDVWFLRRRAKQ